MNLKNPPRPGRGACSSGKVCFFTRKQAKAGRRRVQSGAVGIYRCPECDFFHIGHKPKEVRRGDMDKSRWLEGRADA